MRTCLALALWGGLAALTIESSGSVVVAAQSGCVADCNEDGAVTVDELIRGVDVALDATPLADCRAADPDENDVVTVDELVAAVGDALDRCAGPAPTPTPTPPGEESVCGGLVTSIPQLCQLQVVPASVQVGEPLRVSFGISDLEGDIDTLCIGIALGGEQPSLLCQPISPSGALVNGFGQTDELQPPLPAGEYTFAMQVRDAAGHESNVATASFSVVAATP